MDGFNIYLAGVGGQGIGLLSEVILRAADHAGFKVKGVDTHGLAQRGGIVASQIRIGDSVFSPLIPRHQADLIVALERHEALRAVIDYGKKGAALIYYNTVWQPLEVRLEQISEVTAADVAAQCSESGIRMVQVYEPDLDDVRMQNSVVLAHLARQNMIPGVGKTDYLQAMADLMANGMLAENTSLFKRICGIHA